MSNLLNISRQSYIDIENGTRIPRADLLFNISLITNKKITFFYNEHNLSKLDHIAFLLRGKTEAEKKSLPRNIRVTNKKNTKIIIYLNGTIWTALKLQKHK
ncbi:hypothetical protein AYY22_00980 [Photobacterium kishitanii]|nr:hypothetical protein AYY22_00980 [Photobacterium kishitanii]